jgi:hypothetical protein
MRSRNVADDFPTLALVASGASVSMPGKRSRACNKVKPCVFRCPVLMRLNERSHTGHFTSHAASVVSAKVKTFNTFYSDTQDCPNSTTYS